MNTIFNATQGLKNQQESPRINTGFFAIIPLNSRKLGDFFLQFLIRIINANHNVPPPPRKTSRGRSFIL
jgi:hypothetical protein